MKNLILAILFIAASCQKQVVDCDNMQSHCVYILPSFSDCTPNGNEIGWQWDRVKYDTIDDNLTWGCPEQIEKEFLENEKWILEQPTTSQDYIEFKTRYPSTCDCD